MKALVGLSIPPNQQQDILRVLQNDPVIRTIHNVTAVSLVAHVTRLGIIFFRELKSGLKLKQISMELQFPRSF